MLFMLKNKNKNKNNIYYIINIIYNIINITYYIYILYVIMEKIPNEILLLMGYKLDFNSILSYSIVNKNNYKLFDNIFYQQLSFNYYGSEFWKIACKRPCYTSYPLNNYKQELIRIENFQKQLDKLNQSRWTKKDFYNYWKHRDSYMTNQDFFNVLDVL